VKRGIRGICVCFFPTLDTSWRTSHVTEMQHLSTLTLLHVNKPVSNYYVIM